MPELPDITAYLEALAPRVLGQTIERLEIVKPFVLRTVDPGPDAYTGTRVTELRRLGKRIALGCAPATTGASAVRTDTAPHDRLWIVMHLMIAGRLRWRPPGPTIPKSLVLTRLHFPSGVLHFTEAGSKRRATLHLVRGDAALQEFERGGLEVLDAPLEVFAERLRSENHTLNARSPIRVCSAGLGTRTATKFSIPPGSRRSS